MEESPHPPAQFPTLARHGMVATTHPLAAQIGVDILKSGGNAIDAAVATNAAMGLMEPPSCGIGGDLFALVYTAKDKKLHALNASGRSPLQLNLQRFRDRNLAEIPLFGPLSWSVPGCVDGWHTLLEKFGTRSLADLLAPSIHYANRGFPVPKTIAGIWANAAPRLRDDPDAAATFLPNDRPPAVDEIFRNPNLARTYQTLAAGGRDAFYRGPIAQDIVAFSQKIGGYFSMEDFDRHTSTWVQPVSTDYRGNRVWEIPPPGQGISVLQMLNILEGFDLRTMGPSADFWHLFIESKKLAYAPNRARFYADPDFGHIPTDWLISKPYAAQRRKLIQHDRALADIEPGDPKLTRSDTIYLCAVDKDRNCVSLIQSNYHAFGSGLVPGTLGFPLQNRGNLFALDETHPNCLHPGKRPFHTIIPAMVMRDEQPLFVFGVMGGDMQPQGQVQVLVNLFDFDMDIHQAGAAPRMEHTGSATPTGKKASGVGTVTAERPIPEEILADLRRRGHHIQYGGPNAGGYQGIYLDPATGNLLGASEPRRDGRAIGY